MQPRRHDESGIALLVTMMVIFIATVLVVAALMLAQHSINASGMDRNRTQSVAVAEAGLDQAVHQIQSAPGDSLPCSIAPGTMATTPAPSSYSVTVTYYGTNPPTSSPLPCTGPTLSPSTPPASAEIVSKAHNGAIQATGRAMEALITLTPESGLTEAIFGNQIISFSNNATVNRTPGSTAGNADLYTNGDYICANAQSVDGSVYAQGYIQASNTCSVTGSWDADGNVSTTQNSNVGGDIYSVQGNVSLSGNTTVAGSVYAAGTATGGQVSGGTYSNDGSLTPVPTKTFPQDDFDSATSADWSSQGYNVISNNDCTSDATSVYNAISSMATTTQNTVIDTSCALTWGNSTKINLGANLVIYADGGFTTTQNVDFESTPTSATRNLEWIVPWQDATTGATPSANCSSATPPDITTSNLTTFGNKSSPPNIDVLFYTPCDITLSNKQAMVGQIYADGTVTVQNNFNMTYQKMPLWGYSADTQVQYIAEYDYKREVPYS
ncbi:MAG TPA: hypothetical protein VFP54_03555 [Acidimicrobiales bacterium]|nr:hypothetical protein [Acidimicrobiales bacterium]